MITPELLSYIKRQMNKGVDMETLQSRLADHGWEPADVEEAFSKINAAAPAQPEPVQPAPNPEPVQQQVQEAPADLPTVGMITPEEPAKENTASVLDDVEIDLGSTSDSPMPVQSIIHPKTEMQPEKKGAFGFLKVIVWVIVIVAIFLGGLFVGHNYTDWIGERMSWLSLNDTDDTMPADDEEPIENDEIVRELSLVDQQDVTAFFQNNYDASVFQMMHVNVDNDEDLEILAVIEYQNVLVPQAEYFIMERNEPGSSEFAFGFEYDNNYEAFPSTVSVSVIEDGDGGDALVVIERYEGAGFLEGWNVLDHDGVGYFRVYGDDERIAQLDDIGYVFYGGNTVSVVDSVISEIIPGYSDTAPVCCPDLSPVGITYSYQSGMITTENIEIIE